MPRRPGRLRSAKHRLALLALAAPALVLVVASPAGCNVFASLDRCSSDSDCTSGATCDTQGRFCLRADASVQDAPIDASDAGDAADARDAAPLKCSGTFGTPKLVPGLESLEVFSARLTSDENQLFYSANNITSPDISIASRSNAGAPFDNIALKDELNTAATSEYWPTISGDQLDVFFESDRSLDKDGGVYALDRARIWWAHRASKTVFSFEEPKLQPLFRTDTGAEGAPYLHPGGDSLYFFSTNRDAGSGDEDLFVATGVHTGLSVIIKSLGNGVNTNLPEQAPVVSFDEKTLFFARGDQITAKRDIWVATRVSIANDFPTATLVTELNTAGEDFPTWLSDDDCRLYFVSDRPTDPDAGADASTAGVLRLWMASRPPPK